MSPPLETGIRKGSESSIVGMDQVLADDQAHQERDVHQTRLGVDMSQ